MAVLSPITNFSAPASTSCISSDKISCSVTSRASLKCLQRFSGRLGHGSDDSSGRVLVKYKQVPVRSNSDFARYVVLGEAYVIQHIIRLYSLKILYSHGRGDQKLIAQGDDCRILEVWLLWKYGAAPL